MALPLATRVLIATINVPASGAPATLLACMDPSIAVAIGDWSVIGVDVYAPLAAVNITDASGGNGALALAIGNTQQLPCVNAHTLFKIASASVSTTTATAYIHLRRDASWV